MLQLFLRHGVWFCFLCGFGLRPGTATAKAAFLVKYQGIIPEPGDSTLVFSSPQAIAIDIDGNIYIADTGQNRLVKLDARGHLLDFVGGFGWEHQEFDRPLDVSVKTGLDVFVADYNNERIERYDRNLNFISSLTSENIRDPSLQFGFPGSVDLSRHGELFICDNENDRILKLDSFGAPVLSFGDFNWGEGQLGFPVRVEISEDDRVFVVDQESNQIVVFDYYGNYVTRFGESVLKKPVGLCFQGDLLLVADSGHNRVVVFDASYREVFHWGTGGAKIAAFDNPVDVAAFGQRVYVLDSNNSRVQIFTLERNAPPTN